MRISDWSSDVCSSDLGKKYWLYIQYIRPRIGVADAIVTRPGTAMRDSEWQERDEYYWTGPGGWTICRVYVDGVWQHELWSPAGTRIGLWASFALAAAEYARQAKP